MQVRPGDQTQAQFDVLDPSNDVTHLKLLSVKILADSSCSLVENSLYYIPIYSRL